MTINLYEGGTYQVFSKLLIHTKPKRTVIACYEGDFVKETDKFLCFKGFRIKKDRVLKIKAMIKVM